MTTRDRGSMVARCAWWMRSVMGLRDVTDEAPAPTQGPARCDLHGVGHSRGAFAARYGGMLALVLSAGAFMVAARPASAREGGERSATARTVGASLGALGVSGFVAGRAIERRTRYHVWLQCETRAITGADIGALADTARDLRGRSDVAWAPDQLWIVGADLEPGVDALARERGVRCFVARGGHVQEV
jgi:hypothetical protein